MRDFLNGILAFIMAESLTDDEFETVTSTIPLYDQSTYDDLSRILATRDLVTDMQARLVAYYTAKGATITQADTAKSEIFMGAVL